MRVLVVLAHPDNKSFNHAITDTAIKKLKKNNYEVVFHDLYEEKFNPVLQATEISKNGKYSKIIEKHCDELKNADGILVIHPNWWGQPPAILKGWIDKVFRPGITYEFKEGDNGEGIPIGLLKVKIGLVLNTSDTKEEREQRVFKDPLETIWKNCIFGLCGIKNFYRRTFGTVVDSSESQRKEWLMEVELIINKYFPKTGKNEWPKIYTWLY
jgi:putative NADPH-quinone reductase